VPRAELAIVTQPSPILGRIARARALLAKGLHGKLSTEATICGRTQEKVTQTQSVQILSMSTTRSRTLLRPQPELRRVHRAEVGPDAEAVDFERSGLPTIHPKWAQLLDGVNMWPTSASFGPSVRLGRRVMRESAVSLRP
jgi:hypothetical protein